MSTHSSSGPSSPSADEISHRQSPDSTPSSGHIKLEPVSDPVVSTDYTPPTRTRHPGIHSRKPYPCNFTHCPRSYLTLLNLQKHQLHHPKAFPCRYIPCVYAFVSAKDRTIHEVISHGKSEEYVCYICGYSTFKRSAIRAHVMRMHQNAEIGMALARIIDGVEEGDTNREKVEVKLPVIDKSGWFHCYLCKCFSTEKDINMYQHVWRMHKDVKMKDVMERMRADQKARKG